MSEGKRRGWAVAAAVGLHDGVDLSLLDPCDEDERRMLIEAEHPEFQAALDMDEPTVAVGGAVVNPVLHIALHQVVAQQLWDGDPAVAWDTAQRLTARGHERHEVLHMLMFVVGEDIRRALAGEQPRSDAELADAFHQLPQSWLRQ